MSGRKRYILYYEIPAWERVVHEDPKVFSYYGLRMSFFEAMARAVGLVGDRVLYEIRTVGKTSKTCQCRRFRWWNDCRLVACKYSSKTLDEVKCECKNPPKYIIVIRKSGKYYGIYLCEEHMKIFLESCRIILTACMNTIISNMYSTLFSVAHIPTSQVEPRLLSYEVKEE